MFQDFEFFGKKISQIVTQAYADNLNSASRRRQFFPHGSNVCSMEQFD